MTLLLNWGHQINIEQCLSQSLILMRDDPEKKIIIMPIITISFAIEYKTLIIVLTKLYIMVISEPAAFLGQK